MSAPVASGGNLHIGEDGFGFRFAMKTLSGGRIDIATQSTRYFEQSLKYSKDCNLKKHYNGLVFVFF